MIDPRDVYCPSDNPNRMPLEQYMALRDYIAEVGFDSAIKVTLDPEGVHKYIISDGHHRIRAAIELGFSTVGGTGSP